MGLEKNGKVAWNKFKSGHINGDKIFSLLTKNIKIDNPNKILLLGLESPVFYKLTKEKYSNSDIDFICDDDIKSTLSFCKFIPENNIFYVDFDDNNILNLIMDSIKNKKYDLIIGNPPYDRSLHLKIIDIAMQHLSDEGKACFIHPARWIQDPLWKIKKNNDHKKYEKSIVNYIEDFEILKLEDIFKLFNIGITIDVMISYINKNLKSPIDIMSKLYSNKQISIMNKILEYSEINNINSHIEKDKIDGIRIKCSLVGHPYAWNIKTKAVMCYEKDEPLMNGYCISNGKFFSEGRSYYMKGKTSLPVSIKFDTINEAENYLKCIRSNFYRHILMFFMTDLHIPYMILPWMQDYTKEWTNKRLCEFFNLTEEESKYMCSEIN